MGVVTLMQLNKINFPLYMIRTYISLDKNLLGITKIKTRYGEFVLDDDNYPGTFAERRLAIHMDYPKDKIYKLKEQVTLLRQLVKYKSGSIFIDYEGKIIKYVKSSKLFTTLSREITRVRPYKDNWNIIYCADEEIPFLVSFILTPQTKYASIMQTQWGPFLYDLTKAPHPPYKRKI